MKTAIVCLVLALTARAQTLDTLYQSGEWFQFRDAMAREPHTTPFHRGMLALAFHDWEQADKELGSVLRSDADPVQAAEAGLALQRMYTMSGRLKDARALLAHMDRLMRGFRQSGAISGSALRQFESLRAELAALTGYPDQVVVSRGRSRLLYAEADNQLLVPLTVNGTAANFLIDTGSEMCYLSAAEARRLGLAVHRTSMALSGWGPGDETASGVAVASDLVIGNFHLRNVVFGIVSGDDDDDEPGILGMPVLLALETLRWNSDGTLDFGFPAQPLSPAGANLCLAGGLLFTRASIAGRGVLLGLDTGSYDSELFPRFGREFADVVQGWSAKAPRDIGNGATDPAAATLEQLPVRLGGLDTLMRPAVLLSEEPVDDAEWVHGWLGIDLLTQSRSTTLDLRAMRLTLEGGGVMQTASTYCALPPEFSCAPGFTCAVKAEPDQPCYIDRLPIEAWPGNPLHAEPPDIGGRCVLSTGARCDDGFACAAVFDSNQSCHIVKETLSALSHRAPAAAARTGVSSTPAPPALNAAAIVQRGLKYESLDLSPARDYVYLEEKEQRMLDGSGKVKDTSSETHEVMNLYDQTYERLVRKNGEPLPPSKARAEQARFDKAIEKRAHETPEAKAKREDAERKDAAESLACDDEFLHTFTFRLDGSETVSGRPAWIIAADPVKNAQPRCRAMKMLAQFHFRLWIDQSEYRWAKFEGDNIGPVTWAKLLVRVPAGAMHLVFEQARHEDGAWLASRMRARISAKLLLIATVRTDITWTYSGYRKFQTDSRLLPAADERK